MTSAVLARLAGDAAIDDLCAALERDGGAIVENFVDEETLAALWTDLRPSLEHGDYGDNVFSGHKTKRVSSLFARSPRVADVLTQPLFLGAARSLIERPVRVWFGGEQASLAPNVQVSATQLIQIWPEEGEQVLHRDDSSHLISYPAPIRRVQVMLAMSEFTADNGGTMVVPGSHLWDDERPPRRDEAVPTEMAAGSALVWVGGTYHGGGRNVTGSPRTGLTISLLAGNLRQEENQYLAIPRDTVREYPEEVRRLLGYTTCPPFLGWHESSDPHRVLAEHE
ncbi:phytanoyl-CoA dioxygenase family protein [Amycolatopsis cihanbeyliensis]|uniref:Ectoine hydroxylase-related dioxygenase (Phytanoyl-CoA dioxygenase family) n=1 Tax=Amycolatopsis cihanbeyliensis TaxID=1128664 RepID=A0A542DJC3_AMYCI|nr:phytanoyl-CoA dioxygenase family protein [Amycolatopsis cihanbeyliensis]TQJ03201.1 ectoine hydroxylase-related dioxygenase (phytanoyl-CoA dioxygenase family) [Amycolatopsis cihanbeyliensis]WCB87238.1 EfrOIII [Amycolatopsis cihanbeyliensis]